MLALRVIHLQTDDAYYQFRFLVVTSDEPGIVFAFAPDTELIPDSVDAWIPRTVAELPV